MTLNISQYDELPAEIVIIALEATRDAINNAIRGLEALDQPIYDAEQERLWALSDYEDAEEDAPNDAAGDASVAAAYGAAVAARDAVLCLIPQCRKGQYAITKAERDQVEPLSRAIGRRTSNRLIAAGDPAAIAARDALWATHGAGRPFAA